MQIEDIAVTHIHEESSEEHIIYELIVPIFDEQEVPDFSTLHQCNLPHSISKDFWQQKFSHFPFIQQDLPQRSLPNVDFPVLPTIMVSDIIKDKTCDLNDDNCQKMMKESLPDVHQQWSFAQCEKWAYHKDSSKRLRQDLLMRWLTFEPYIPKWEIITDDYDVPLDDQLPSHASSFRSLYNYDNQILAQEKYQAISIHTRLRSGVRFNIRQAALILLFQIDTDQPQQILQQVINQRTFEDPKTFQFAQLLVSFSKELVKQLRSLKNELQLNSYEELQNYKLTEFIQQFIITKFENQTNLRKMFHNKQKFRINSNFEQFQSIYAKYLIEADRLDHLAMNVALPKLSIQEAEYLYNESTRKTAQISAQEHDFQSEVSEHNAAYQMFSQPISIEGGQQKLQKFSGPKSEAYDMDFEQRYAPHSQSLPPPDHSMYFYNHYDGELTKDVIISNRLDLPLPQWLKQTIFQNPRLHPLVSRPRVQAPSIAYYKSKIYGWGLFACQPLQVETMFQEYQGELIGSLLSEVRDEAYQSVGFKSVYQFSVKKDYVVDATFCGNLGRFINHSCSPNSESQLLFKVYGKLAVKDQIQSDGIGVVLQTVRNVRAGVELTQNYNMAKVPFDEKIECGCETSKCTGLMN